LNILAVKYPNVFDTNICPWDLSNFAKRPLIASLTVLYSCRFEIGKIPWTDICIKDIRVFDCKYVQ
jgi:hypothetical protein